MYNLAQPHAVSAVVGGGLPSHTFAYDANGNLDTLDSTPMISWSSYDKPVAITTASVTYGFDYGPDRARYRKVHNGQTTHYVGKNFEAINASGVGFDTHRHYVRANGRVVMIREDVNGAVTHRYVHTDHLGSITALTDEATGTVVARYSYDAWGLRRNPTTWQPAAISSSEKRGYTGHEHLDDVGIIHMNGRLCSPSLGRMLSPDPVTQAPENAQNYNRYSYAYNNPLKYTDPSGYTNCHGSFDHSHGFCLPEIIVTAPRLDFGAAFSYFPNNFDYNFAFNIGEIPNFDFSSLFSNTGDQDDGKGNPVAQKDYRQKALDGFNSWVDDNADSLGDLTDNFRKYGSDYISSMDLSTDQTHALVYELSAAAGVGLVGGGMIAIDRNGMSHIRFAGIQGGLAVGASGTIGRLIYDGPRSGLVGWGGSINVSAQFYGGAEYDYIMSGGSTGHYIGPAVGMGASYAAELLYGRETWSRSF